MRLAVSNIAWTPAEDDTAGAVLRECGVRRIEVAPTVRWATPLAVSEAEAVEYRAAWQGRGIEIVALQSLLFGRPDLTVFGTHETRLAMVEYLAGLCRLARWLGATRLVFGSPANRRPGSLDAEARDRIGTAFFRAVGARAADEGTVVCIEPNPAEYGCEWIQSVAEAGALVEAVDHPGFGLHLDAGGMLLRGDTAGDVAAALARPGVCHLHASDPMLAPLGAGHAGSAAWHQTLASTLAGADYDGCVSLEMRRQPDGDRADLLRASVRRLTEWYGDRQRRP
jgi:D-psicose/D-tagatose/L-ribulose 3-epimerase